MLTPCSEQYTDYLHDESLLTGYADTISFPASEGDVAADLEALAHKGIAYTVQGSRTGLVGAAVSEGGHILNLSRMTRMGAVEPQPDGTAQITVEAGVTLQMLRETVSRAGYFWPPQPTEQSATVGGVYTTGAHGPNAFRFGESKQYAASVHMVKDVVTELTLTLLPLPEDIWGICFFFHAEEQLCAFVERMKEQLPQTEDAAIWSIEYIDRAACDLIASYQTNISAIQRVPALPEDCCGMLYLVLAGTTDGIEMLCEPLMEESTLCDEAVDAWAVSGTAEVERMDAYRHAAAECCNRELLAARSAVPCITKLGSDFIFPSLTFSELLNRYRSELQASGLRGVIFGHVMANHLHVNLLPDSEAAYQEGIALMRRWAANCIDCGGILAGEHGLGRLKRKMFSDLCD